MGTRPNDPLEPAAPRLGRAGLLLVGAAVALTLAHLAVLVLRLPVFVRADGCYTPFREGPLGSPGLIFALIMVVALVVGLARRGRLSTAARLLLLGLLGASLQVGFALTEGRGLDGLRDVAVKSGHAQFAELAVPPTTAWEVAAHYQRLLDGRPPEKVTFARSKPPGQLLLYVATERLAHALHPARSATARLAWLRTFIAFTWPLLTFLVLVPLYRLARALAGEPQARLAVILYPVVPAVALVTLHTDGVFFPTFVVGCMLAASAAYQRASLARALGAGAACYLAAFCSFGLVVVVPLSLGVVLAHWLGRAERRRHARRALAVAGALLGGMLATDVLFRLVLDYRIESAFATAFAWHTSWKAWIPQRVGWVHSGLSNLLEFGAWLGAPLVVYAGARGAAALGNCCRWRPRREDVAVATWLLAVLALAFFGRTRGEVERLWLFLVPLICLAAAAEVVARCGDDHRVVGVVVALQWLTVYLTKVSWGW